MICIVDLETTSLNPFDAEIIEGHFICVDHGMNVKSTYDLKCRPIKWSNEAEAIHGISQETANTYKRFSASFKELTNWIEDNSIEELWMHTNPASYGKEVFYDYAVLRVLLSYHSDESYWVINKIKPYSTHTLCKIFKDSYNFENLRLDSICKVLDIKLDHHNCVSDANACLEIMRKLIHTTDRNTIRKILRSEYDTERIGDDDPARPTKSRRSSKNIQSRKSANTRLY
jgi:DNA polymerase III epsilon subunit-like protein